MANPPLPNDNDSDSDSDNESIDGTDDGINYPTNDATTTDPTDLLWIHQLRACGFQDEREIRHALQQARQEQQQDEPITLEILICAIITAREDSALARDMDEARRQSEMEHQQEQQRLSNQRTEETRQRLLNASLHELLHPPPQFSKLFFPRSWLLRHPPLQSLLEDITLHHMDIKKELIQLLQLEKNAFRWYSHGIAKSYYTHHLTKVLGDLEISLVANKLQEICHQINEGHALMSKQNSSGIPLLYMQAQMDYPTFEKDLDDDKKNHHEKNDNEDDDNDDEVQVLDDEQIQQIKEKVNSPKPAAPIDIDGEVDGDD